MAASTNQNNVVSFSQPPNKRTKTLVSFSQPLNKRTKLTPYNMPDDVIEYIISFLPAKQVCRLSILSKRFRDSWKLCRDLSFDRKFARNLSRNDYRIIVSNFFHNANTWANTFKMYYDTTDQIKIFHFWIRGAARLGIKELELDFSPSRKYYRISNDRIDAESLRILKLVNCELHFPLNSNGLRHLSEITLQNTRALPDTVESIFVNCVFLRAMKLIHCGAINSLKASAQNLKILVVQYCKDVDAITVNAPSLRTLHYHGKITTFSFCCDLPCLSDVILNIAQPRRFRLLSQRENIVSSLALVKILTVSSIFIEALCARVEEYQYKDMEFFLRNLKEFHLIVAPKSFIDPSDVIVFLKKCPSIERVFIDLRKNAFADSLYWENRGKNYLNESQIIFPFLKYVKIKGFTLKELPVSMARYFLKNAINLKSLVVVKARNHDLPESYSAECLRWEISSNARIEIHNYRRDKNTVMPEYLRGV